MLDKDGLNLLTIDFVTTVCAVSRAHLVFELNSLKGLEYEAFYENLWQLEQDYTNYIENFEWNQQRREKYAENNDFLN